MSELSEHIEAMADSLDGHVPYEDIHRELINALFLSRDQDARFAEVKADTLREAADDITLPGTPYYAVYADEGYRQAEQDAEDWLRYRADQVQGKND